MQTECRQGHNPGGLRFIFNIVGRKSHLRLFVIISTMIRIPFLLVVLLVLTACTANTGVVPSPTQPLFTPTFAVTIRPSALPPSATPSATPEPLALRVDGSGISLVEYNNELLRLQDVLKNSGQSLSEVNQQKKILDDFTNQLLLANAAFKDRYKIEDAAVQKRLQDAIEQAGGEQAYQSWLQKNHYTQSEFLTAFRRSIAAAWKRDKIIEAAPQTADQVHARQILLLEEATAERYYNQLKAGADFATLAFQADPDLGGDLGWFPKGYIFLPEIEKIAFDVEPGKFSPITKTTYGFHIVQVIERKANQPLSEDARRMIQRNLLNEWLKEQRVKANTEILVSKQ